MFLRSFSLWVSPPSVFFFFFAIYFWKSKVIHLVEFPRSLHFTSCISVTSPNLCISCKLIVGTRAVVGSQLWLHLRITRGAIKKKKALLSRPHPDKPNWDFWEWGPSRQWARGESTALLEACSDSGSNFCPECFIESACSSGSPLQESPKTWFSFSLNVSSHGEAMSRSVNSFGVTEWYYYN